MPLGGKLKNSCAHMYEYNQLLLELKVGAAEV